MYRALADSEINEIQRQAREKLGLCRKSNDIIGSQIFPILGVYARTIFYPLGKDAPWGFTRISGSKNDATLEKPFVAINTSVPVDCQVFAAAHELYHIWYERHPDILPADLLDEQGKKIHEKKANRFAAEFLMDETLLRQEIKTYQIPEFTVKEVLQLAHLFTVPYQAMAKRLNEIGCIDDRCLRTLLSETDASIEQAKKKYAIPAAEPDCRIAMDNLSELAIDAYGAHRITYEKLEYLLDLCGLKPQDVGIETASAYAFPSDAELDSIMEE